MEITQVSYVSTCTKNVCPLAHNNAFYHIQAGAILTVSKCRRAAFCGYRTGIWVK